MAKDNGQNPTFTGPGFGTLLPQSPNGSAVGAPHVLSRRGVMRGAMPAIYHETDFAMRFIGALERVLDPIAGVLDALPEHFSPNYAPRPVIDMLSAWLSVETDEAQELDARRESVRMSAELGRRRGTVAGLELALRLNFPDVSMRVEDEGGVRWSLDGKPAPAPEPRFVVYVDKAIPEERQTAVARCIERFKPVSARYKLRVKAAKGGS